MGERGKGLLDASATGVEWGRAQRACGAFDLPRFALYFRHTACSHYIEPIDAWGGAQQACVAFDFDLHCSSDIFNPHIKKNRKMHKTKKT